MVAVAAHHAVAQLRLSNVYGREEQFYCNCTGYSHLSDTEAPKMPTNFKAPKILTAKKGLYIVVFFGVV